jgi:hypothetical protein
VRFCECAKHVSVAKEDKTVVLRTEEAKEQLRPNMPWIFATITRT